MTEEDNPIKSEDKQSENTSKNILENPEGEDQTIVETLEEVSSESDFEINRESDPKAFLEKFDWHKYEQGVDRMDEDQWKEFDKALENTVGFIKKGDVIDGLITKITDRDAIIDINSKSEGVISLNEFRYNPHLTVGDTIPVLVERREDKSGQLVLSHKKAKVIKSWQAILSAQETGEIVTGHIKCRTKGGMIVDIFGIETFLPGSQIDVKPIKDYDDYVDKIMEFKVVKINHEFKNIVVSHKAIIEADIKLQKKQIISGLEKGQVLKGVVKNITSYGVFVDLGGVDGLVHVTDLSWSRINHPSEVLQLEQTLNVVVLDFDEEKNRIQLGLKQLSPHPWETLDANLSIGDKVKGKVVVLADYGAFVEVVKGIEGLIHVSEMSWSTHLRSSQDFLKIGDEIEVQILTLDREERKMSLGMKQLQPDPWTNIIDKYPIDSTHEGTVRNYTNFGIFLELEEGIDGLVHISDLSWTSKIKHPSEFVSVGDRLKIKILELDTENKKISLGHKQTQKNPWDDYEIIFTLNSIHEASVMHKTDKGAMIVFKNKAESFVPLRHMQKEDGSMIDKGESNVFKIIEFSKELRRIVSSHMETFKEDRVKYSDLPKRMGSTERSTFSDIINLTNLKKEIENDDKKRK